MGLKYGNMFLVYMTHHYTIYLLQAEKLWHLMLCKDSKALYPQQVVTLPHPTPPHFSTTLTSFSVQVSVAILHRQWLS